MQTGWSILVYITKKKRERWLCEMSQDIIIHGDSDSDFDSEGRAKNSE